MSRRSKSAPNDGLLPSPDDPCPCGRTKYAACCGRYHAGALAPDAEALMRSRYSGYVLQLEPYLLSTWHPNTRPTSLGLSADGTRWLGLEIKRTESTTPDTAIVEFVARDKVGGRAHRMHETSRFVREGGCWYYVEGDMHAAPRTAEQE